MRGRGASAAQCGCMRAVAARCSMRTRVLLETPTARREACGKSTSLEMRMRRVGSGEPATARQALRRYEADLPQQLLLGE